MMEDILPVIKKSILVFALATINIPLFFLIATTSRIWRSIQPSHEYNVYWGTEPVVNFYHWSMATKNLFTKSEFITRYNSFIIDGRADSTLFILHENLSVLKRFKNSLKENWVFVRTFSRILKSANLVCITCDGFMFQHYNGFLFNYRVEFYLLKFARVKVCVMPYGSDAYVYSRVQDKNWLLGLITDYPKASTNQARIAKRLDFFVKEADIFLPGMMLFDGIGRSDWITPSTLCLDTSLNIRRHRSRGDCLVVTHAPNHRAVKGTKFIIESIEKLVSEGVAIELKLIERKPNREVMRILAEESDVHIDQLFFDGYAMNALESMSFGVPTVGNFNGPNREFFDRWSHTSNFPMLIANELTLRDLLLHLIANQSYLDEIGTRSKQYVNDYHSPEAFAKNFFDVLKKMNVDYCKWLSNP
jgi:glycosyltransferase involved in cell wall biosynthesis